MRRCLLLLSYGDTGKSSLRRKELRSLIPPLEPLYTVQQSMKAILAEQQMICIPRLMYIPFLTRA